MKEMTNFNLKCFLDAAEELLRADETLRALNLLDNLPGYYRDHVPQEVRLLKREIMSKIATSSFYANSDNYELSAGAAETFKEMDKSLRGKLVIEDMVKLKDPVIYDMGPGEYWLPRMLKLHNFNFTYKPIHVNAPAFNFYKEHFDYNSKLTDTDSLPKMFFAGEVLEHLHNEADIRMEMERYAGLCDVVHISTPKYTFDTLCTDWRAKGDLGHLRTYTTKEFFDVISQMFPDYSLVIYDSQILHARLVLKETKFKELQENK